MFTPSSNNEDNSIKGKDNVYEITFLKTIMLCMYYVLFRVRQLYRAILEL